MFEENDVFITKIPLNNLLKNKFFTNKDISGVADNDTEKVTDKTMNSLDKHKVTDLIDVAKVTDKVTDKQAAIIVELKKKSTITTRELAELVRISQRKIKENIAKLKEYGIVERIGPAKGGFWKVSGFGF